MLGTSRVYWNLARGFYAVSSVLAIIGIFNNSLIFLTTVKTKSLRSTYNILIGICAIADILHQCGVLVKTPMVFDVYLEMDSDLCIALMFLPQLGVGIGCICILCVGLDRLFAVMLPIRYRVIDKSFVGYTIASLMLTYCAFEACLIICFRKPQRVVCDILSPYPDQGLSFFLGGMICINVCTAIVYFATWINLRNKCIVVSSSNRIFRSLLIIMIFDVTGWFLTPSLIVFLQLLQLDAEQLFAFTYLSTIFVNFALASKLLIYYSTSSEYKAAIKTFLLRFFRVPSTNSISTAMS